MNTCQPVVSSQDEKSHPEISLIIPVYNVEPYIAECMESALHQTFPHIEIICVDDRGTDHSMQIVERYAQEDERIRIVRNAENLGLAASRNVGIAHSSAPYIMFLDSDDYYEPTMCEKMHRAMESSGADIAACGTQVLYEADAHMKKSDDTFYAVKFSGTQEVCDALIAACDVCAWNKIYRRSLMETYEIQFPDGLKYEDAYFFHVYMAHARTIHFVNEKLYHYRRREGSIMNLTFAKANAFGVDHIKIAFRLHDYLCKWHLLEEKYAWFCQFFLTYLDLAVQHSPSQDVQDDVMLQAGDFAHQHLRHTEQLEPQVGERLRVLMESYRPSTKGFLLRRETRPFMKRWSLLGIPLYKVIYSPSKQKHYFCGLQIRRKKYGK